ncbi:MAG: hypothetical protein HQL27_01380 [Candidatus Omnitrophica bacterium]|nr:hypothetical protein [Candidatus Omnitrophota bacterium]
MRELTSEEKLLQIIRKKEKPSDADKKDNTSSLAKDKNLGAKEKKELDFISIGSYLLVLLGITLFTVLAMRIFAFDKGMKQEEAKSGKKEQKAVKNNKVSGNLNDKEARPFDYYSKKIEKRDIFMLPWEKSDGNTGDKVLPGGDLAKRLRVVGIVLDDSPKAIIEDLSTKETLFISKGEKFGEAVLKEVTDGEVIFVYNGEKVILKP